MIGLICCSRCDHLFVCIFVVGGLKPVRTPTQERLSTRTREATGRDVVEVTLITPRVFISTEQAYFMLHADDTPDQTYDWLSCQSYAVSPPSIRTALIWTCCHVVQLRKQNRHFCRCSIIYYMDFIMTS